MENQDPSFMLRSTINRIGRADFDVTLLKYDVSKIMCTKDANEINFFRPYSEENILIPNRHMKDFIMAAIESYCTFSPEFADKEIDITVTVKTK